MYVFSVTFYPSKEFMAEVEAQCTYYKGRCSREGRECGENVKYCQYRPHTDSIFCMCEDVSNPNLVPNPNPLHSGQFRWFGILPPYCYPAVYAWSLYQWWLRVRRTLYRVQMRKYAVFSSRSLVRTKRYSHIL